MLVTNKRIIPLFPVLSPFDSYMNKQTQLVRPLPYWHEVLLMLVWNCIDA